jgi:hypothetical protein
MIKYARNNDTISGRLHDEIVMMDVEKGKYFAFNRVATSIWEILENPTDLDTICKELQNEYEVKAEQCKLDAEKCLKDLLQLNLITTVYP